MNNQYKLEQLREMLDAEEGYLGAGSAGYGAHLTHWSGRGNPINIDADALRVLVNHYEQKSKEDEEDLTVDKLNREQLDSLKMDYLYGDDTRDSEVSMAAENWLDIPDEVIFEHYAGISFVPEDFGTVEDCEEENKDHRP